MKASRKWPDLERLRARLQYDPATGAMHWKERPLSDFEGYKRPAAIMHAWWSKRFQGKPAFASKNASGHMTGQFENVAVYAHHVVWALEHGEWPALAVNHIDGDPANNQIANLRLASQREVTRNQSMHAHNRSGRIGIHRRRDTGKWVAKIGREGVEGYQYLGCFDAMDEAIGARLRAEENTEYHQNHGSRPSRRDIPAGSNEPQDTSSQQAK